jgi:poly-beta-1,6-N-acetyl-D-glucosamine synthase
MFWFILGLIKKSKSTNSNEPFISVILAAHNEENHLANSLKALVEQSYPKEKLEIIVVNDRSTDQTQSIIDEWTKEFNFITSAKIETIPKDQFPKKNALMKGIELSKANILCFTDADCTPSPDWVKNIAGSYSQETTMVVGLAPLVPAKANNPPLWQWLLTYESWFTSFISMSAIQNKFPLTCTGRNFSYLKSEFLQLSGFAPISHSLSGDDDLLMHQFQKSGKGNINIITKHESIVTSQTAETVRQFWRQKTRHFSAGKYYPIDKKIFYLIWHLSNLFIMILPIFSLVFSFISISTSFRIIFAKLIIDFAFHIIGFKKYNKLNLLKYFLFFEFIYPFYILIVGNIGLLKKPKW